MLLGQDQVMTTHKELIAVPDLGEEWVDSVIYLQMVMTRILGMEIQRSKCNGY